METVARPTGVTCLAADGGVPILDGREYLEIKIMSQAALDSAKNALIEFMNEMNAWEKRAYPDYSKAIASGQGWDDAVAAAREGLAAIYEKFLTKKERKTGRLAGPHVSQFPEYDSKLEVIESIECVRKGKFLVTTKKQDPNMPNYFTAHRYKILEKGGQYLIDVKESFSNYKEKWENKVL